LLTNIPVFFFPQPSRPQASYFSSAPTSGLEEREAYNISQKVEGTDACKKVGLDAHNITNITTLYRNLSYPELFEHEKKNNEGVVAKAEHGDTFTVDTGKYTGKFMT
jgi:hypothetical protein